MTAPPKLTETLNTLAEIVEIRGVVGCDDKLNIEWANEIRLGAVACQAVANHRKNQMGITPLRQLAEELGISPTDLCRICDDGKPSGPPDFIRRARS